MEHVNNFKHKSNNFDNFFDANNFLAQCNITRYIISS